MSTSAVSIGYDTKSGEVVTLFILLVNKIFENQESCYQKDIQRRVNYEFRAKVR